MDYTTVSRYLKRMYSERVHISFYIPEQNVNVGIEYFEDDIHYSEENLSNGGILFIRQDWNGNIMKIETTLPIERFYKYDSIPSLKDFDDGDSILVIDTRWKAHIPEDEKAIPIWIKQDDIYEPPKPYTKEIVIHPALSDLLFSEDPLLKAISGNK